MRIWLIFFIPKSGRKYSHINSYNFAITLISEDDRSPHSWSLGCLCAIQTSNDSLTVHLTENLSSWATTRNTSGQKFRRETFCVSCSLLCTLLISLKKKKKASNKKAVFIIPLAWLRYSLYSKVFEPNHSLFTFHLNPSFIIHYSASTPGKK